MDGEGIPAPTPVVVQLSAAGMSRRRCAWTPDEVAILEKLWAEGLSGSRIAAVLGTSRNSVIGKSHRLELPRRDARFCGQRKPYVRRMGHSIPKKRRASSTPRPVSRVVAALERLGNPELRNLYHGEPPTIPQANDIGRKSLLDLENRDCRFPVTQPDGQHLFCASKAVLGLPYCEHHARRCYDLSPSKPKEAPVINGHAARAFA